MKDTNITLIFIILVYSQFFKKFDFDIQFTLNNEPKSIFFIYLHCLIRLLFA